MSAPNFENNVQQKMEELQLVPSEAVWKNVEGAIRKDKRRRRVFFLFSLLFILGIGGWIATRSFQTEKPVSSAPGKIENAVTNSPTTEKETPKKYSDSRNSIENQADGTISKSEENKIDQKEFLTDQSNNKPSSKVPGNNSEVDVKKDQTNSVNNRKSIGSSNSLAATSQRVSDEVLVKKVNALTKHPSKQESIKSSQPGTNNNRANSKEQPTGSVTGNSVLSDDQETEKAGNEKLTDEPSLKTALPIVATSSFDRAMVDDPGMTSISSTTLNQYVINKKDKVKKITSIKSPWHFGVSASIGVSKVVDGGFLNVFDKSVVANTASINQSIGLPGPVNLPSRAPIVEPAGLNPAFSFSVGGFVERKLARRLSLNAGLQYSRFSTTTKIGKRVDSTLFLNNSFTVGVYDRFYLNSSTTNYNNNYHFVEVPVNLQFRLTKFNRIPVFLNGGLSIGYMFKTTALHYDGSYGIYYTNDDLLRKWQLGLNTGVTVRLFSSGPRPLEIGPQLRFNPSNNYAINGSNSQHLLSLGLGLKWYFK